MASSPIACSLSAAEYGERLAAISRVGGSSLINVEERPRQTVLHFRYSTKTRDELQTIVAQEADCCAFLDLSLETSDEELVLTLTAPEEARLIVDDLVRSFRGGDWDSAVCSCADRPDGIGEFSGHPETRTFGELLIDLEEDKAARAVVFGLLAEIERK
jgi:hypothetical protein